MLDATWLQEQKVLERFYAAVKKATPSFRKLAERYGEDVSFGFDPNGRVMTLFGKGAPPALRTVSDRMVKESSG